MVAGWSHGEKIGGGTVEVIFYRVLHMETVEGLCLCNNKVDEPQRQIMTSFYTLSVLFRLATWANTIISGF